MFKRFTPAARRIILIAIEEAHGLGHADIAPEHLLLGALRCGGPAQLALAQLGLREGAIRARIGMRLARANAADADVDADARAEPTLSADAVWAIAAAVRMADDADEPQVASSHVLRALVAAAGARDVLAACAVSEAHVLGALYDLPPEDDEDFAAAVAAIDGLDPDAPARALAAIVLRRGPVAAWLAERGVDEAAVRRAFPAAAPAAAAQVQRPRRAAI